MIDMKINKNFNLKNIKLDLHNELNDGLDVIADDIQKGIQQGRQFGAPFIRNADSTIKKKGFDHPLKETGLMMNPNKMIKRKASRGRQIAKLYPNEERTDIAYWNHEGTDDIPARPFWGISKDAEKRILAKVDQEIERELRRA